MIKIWCENSLKDNFTFFLAFNLRTQNMTANPSSNSQALVDREAEKYKNQFTIHWYSRYKSSVNYSRPPDFLFGDKDLGAYSLTSGDTLHIGFFLPEKKLVFHRIVNIFNVGKQIVHHPPFTVYVKDFDRITKLLNIVPVADDTMEVIA